MRSGTIYIEVKHNAVAAIIASKARRGGTFRSGDARNMASYTRPCCEIQRNYCRQSIRSGLCCSEYTRRRRLERSAIVISLGELVRCYRMRLDLYSPESFQVVLGRPSIDFIPGIDGFGATSSNVVSCRLFYV